MSKSRAAMLEFLRHLESAPTDGRGIFQIGECFDPVNGWRVYLRVDEKALTYSASEARKWADLCDSMALRPEWKKLKEWAQDNARVLRESALVVVRKNRDHVVPEGYAEAMPTAGRA